MSKDPYEADQAPLPDIDTSVPRSARVWDYWLGGKDDYPADREAGDQIRAVMPGIVDTARAVRAFLVRAVQHVVGEGGIRQLLDIGTGLPTVNNGRVAFGQLFRDVALHVAHRH